MFINVTGRQKRQTRPKGPKAAEKITKGRQASKLRQTCRQDTKQGWNTKRAKGQVWYLS